MLRLAEERRVIGRDRVEQRRQLVAGRVRPARAPGSRGSVRQPPLAQPLLQPRRDQRPLAGVQRDAALLVDQRDDRRQIAIGQLEPASVSRAGIAITAGSERAARNRPVAAEHAVEVEQDLDACP